MINSPISHTYAREARKVRQSFLKDYTQMLELRALVDEFLDACERAPRGRAVSIGEVLSVDLKIAELRMWMRMAIRMLDMPFPEGGHLDGAD